jgi:DNA-directed RNA polymerase subunit RPC12/RpoP
MNKATYLNQARGLLAQRDDGLLSYAALELRRCIESIVYEKLQTYAKYVPGQVLDKWQPAHALKALLQFEPGADEEFRLRVAEEDQSGNTKGPWIDMGEHRTLKLGWLERNYNKLGSLLHVPHGEGKALTAGDTRAYLDKVVAELDRVLAGSIIGASLASRISFKCAMCGCTSLVNTQVAERTRRAICINPNCGAVHHLEQLDDQWRVDLEQTEFKCRSCGAPIWLENRHLDVGRFFKCQECKTEHLIVARQWAYGTREEAEKHAS